MTQITATRQPVIRGCGTRFEGAVYIVCDAKMYPKPLEHYLVDTPVTLSSLGLRLQHLGVQMIEDKQGVYHIVDCVGKGFYPSPVHFYAEVLHHGASRKIHTDAIDWSKLTKKSRLLVVHEHAYIANHSEYYDAICDTDGNMPLDWDCMKGRADHNNTKPSTMCVNLLWADTDPNDATQAHVGTKWGLSCLERKIANGEIFETCERPSIVSPTYKPAIYMSLPISKVEIIFDPHTSKHIAARAAVKATALPVNIVNL